MLLFGQPYNVKEVKCGKYYQILPFLLCDRILPPLWQVLCKHHGDFSMRQMTLTLHPTIEVDEWVPEGQIFRCNLCIKIRHQHQLRNTLTHSLSFEGLKCLLSTPQSACSDMSTNTTPAAELSEKLWRAVTALFEYPILSTGGEPLHFWSHLLLDSMASLSLGQIFKEFTYLVNAPPKEACGNLNLVISLEQVFHGKF